MVPQHRADVRSGSKADIANFVCDVRFVPVADIPPLRRDRPRAKDRYSPLCLYKRKRPQQSCGLNLRNKVLCRLVIATMAVVMAVVATTMIVIMVMVMVAIMAVVVVICRGRRRNECRRESTQQHAEPYGTADQQPLHGFLPYKTDVSRRPNSGIRAAYAGRLCFARNVFEYFTDRVLLSYDPLRLG
jgi:hypothetical protein